MTNKNKQEGRNGKSVIENIAKFIQAIRGRKLPREVVDAIDSKGEYEGFWGTYDEFGTSIVRRDSNNGIRVFYDLDGNRTCGNYNPLEVVGK